jgi:hypothetical protein
LAEIEYRPWKKIIVHEVKELPPKDFFEGLAASAEAQKQGANPVVIWLDGVAFVTVMMPDTERVLSDKIDGILHYSVVQFTRTSYQTEKKVTIQGRDHTIRMIKGDDNPDLRNLARFLNELPPKETSS